MGFNVGLVSFDQEKAFYRDSGYKTRLMLYALSIEPMLHNVRSFIAGLCLPGFNTRLSLSAYADDILVFIKNQEDVTRLEKNVEMFRKTSAAKGNWAKTEALAFGSWSVGLTLLPGGLRWKRGGLKYLGFHLLEHDTVKKNWEGVVEKVEGILAQ